MRDEGRDCEVRDSPFRRWPRVRESPMPAHTVPCPPSRDASRRTMVPTVLPVRSVSCAVRSPQVLPAGPRAYARAAGGRTVPPVAPRRPSPRLPAHTPLQPSLPPARFLAPALIGAHSSVCGWRVCGPAEQEARCAAASGPSGLSLTPAKGISGLQVSGDTVSQLGDSGGLGLLSRSAVLSPGALHSIVEGLQDSTLIADAGISGLQISGCAQASMLDATHLPGLTHLQASGQHSRPPQRPRECQHTDIDRAAGEAAQVAAARRCSSVGLTARAYPCPLKICNVFLLCS